MPVEDFECSLSGITPAESDLIDDAEDEDDLGELPLGWTEITIRTRGINPQWTAIQNAKAVLIEQGLAEAPDEQKAAVREFLTVAVDAQFWNMERGPAAVSKYIATEDTLFISPAHRAKALAALGIESEGTGSAPAPEA